MPDLSFLTGDTVFIILFAALCVGFVVFFAVCVSLSKKNADKAAELNAEAADTETPEVAEDVFEPDSDEDWTPPEPEAFPARIVDMRVVIGNVGGTKRPKTGTSFLVTFLTDDGERTEYPVPEELYVTLDLDQTGTLVILNGGFFDFGVGDAYDEGAVEAFEETFGHAEE